MKEEPSVLDYFKSLLTPWRGAPLKIPNGEPEATPEPVAEPLTSEAAMPERIQMVPPSPVIRPAPETERVAESEFEPDLEPEPQPSLAAGPWPWRALVALGLALSAQRALAPAPERDWTAGVILYVIAIAWLLWADWRAEWHIDPYRANIFFSDRFQVRIYGLALGVPLALLAFLTSGGNRFTSLNVFFIVAAMVSFLNAFWLTEPHSRPWIERVRTFLVSPRWNLTISWHAVLLLVVTVIILFFRFYRLDQVPPEMVSDHAEKWLDVSDVLRGETRIFFPRNSGREALQFYLLAGLHQYLGAGINFFTLKLSSALAGILALPFIYLLGKEVANRRVGLLALAFAGVAYWPNVVSRAGMRLPFYMLFTAATLYFLLRGLQTSRRNDFILAGICLGLGFYGYSADRILPLVVLAAVGLYFLHQKSNEQRGQVVWHLLILGLFALILFLPLLRYALQEPDAYAFRTLTRMGSLEQPLPAPAWQIFLDNLWNSLAMFSWSAGEVWVATLPNYPALGIVSGALFHLGLVILLVRYLRRRHWLDLFLLISIPLLMFPSILALAFPRENPSLYRSGGAFVPVFLVVALAFDGLLRALKARIAPPWGSRAAWSLGIFLLFWSFSQDYDLVFNRYQRNYTQSAWNTSEMGRVIRSFVDSFGSPDSAYLVAYPHWADSRLVAINAGFPDRDFALWPEHIPDTLSNTSPKLFLIHSVDVESIEILQSLYPRGYLYPYHSRVENKDFYVFFVLPDP